MSLTGHRSTTFLLFPAFLPPPPLLAPAKQAIIFRVFQTKVWNTFFKKCGTLKPHVKAHLYDHKTSSLMKIIMNHLVVLGIPHV